MMEDQSFHTTILRIAGIPMLVDLEGFYGYMIKSYEHGHNEASQRYIVRTQGYNKSNTIEKC